MQRPIWRDVLVVFTPVVAVVLGFIYWIHPFGAAAPSPFVAPPPATASSLVVQVSTPADVREPVRTSTPGARPVISQPALTPLAALMALSTSNGEGCPSGPAWNAPAGVSVVSCVRWRLAVGAPQHFVFRWTQAQLDLANINAKGVGLWTDYQGTVLDVTYPSGARCRGASLKLTVSGVYDIHVQPQAGRSTVDLWQGEIRETEPLCP